MDTRIVTVDLGERSYDIYIGAGLIYRFADFVPVDVRRPNFYIVTDKNVKKYADQIKAILDEAGAPRVEMLEIEDGEQAKSFRNVEKICAWLLDNNVARDSYIVAVGGGVIGDLTGFCASMILRGISYIQVPTTVLAQVDSSVGGKTAINVPHGKNLIGAFYQPAAVVADIDTLKSLPRREIQAGYAEIAKYGLINNPQFFTWLEGNGKHVIQVDENDMAYAIEQSVESKAEIVQADETEQGQRALLNLGHTYAHALEAAAGYDGRVLHGEAVAIGIVMAFDMSVRLGLCGLDTLERVEKHFEDVGLPTRASQIQPALHTDVDKLIEIMKRDKKVIGGKMRFVACNGIGESFINEDVPEKIIRAVLKDSLAGGGEAGSGGKAGIARSFATRGVKGLWKSAFSSQS